MRSAKMNGYQGKFESSFLSCETDTEAIIKKLFVDSRPYSDILKRLLIINTPDCITDMTNQEYINKIKSMSVKDLIDHQYVVLSPTKKRVENEEVKNFLVITFSNFSPSNNPHYRNCLIMIDIICHSDYWDIGNYKQRPLKIAGYIDGILNNSKLSGIGTLQFVGANELTISYELSGYCLIYSATHGVDDLEEVDIDA